MPRAPWMAVVVACAVVAAATTIVSSQSGRDEVVVASNTMVPMRDGVKLATDIYRPARNGVPVEDRLPLLLQRTPYNKTGATAVATATYLASHGYVVAVQDDRGTWASEGVQNKYVGYGRDGFDAIAWLAALPYVDGRVGMWGTSIPAHMQASAAILNPPALKTVVLNHGGFHNAWLYKIRNHGAFELAQQVGWAFRELAGQTGNPVAREVFQREKAADWIRDLRAIPGLTPLAAAPNYESFLFEMMTKTDYDDHWKQPDLNWSLHYAQTADIPMIHLTGWYETYTSGSILNYVGLSAIKKAPQRLVIGPWVHSGNTRSYSGGVEFGPEAAIADFNTTFHLRWFDRFLKGAAAPADDPPVRLFVMGTGDGHKDANGRLFHGGYWRTATRWPLPEATPTTFYLNAGGALTKEAPRGSVAPTVYTYDPRHPVPTIGGSLSPQAGLIDAGGYDQREQPFTGDEKRGFLGSRPPYLPLSARPDVVVFQTEPLTEDVEVIGPVTVTLFASSTAVDTDFTAKLVDMYPPSRDYPAGYDLNITDGIVRARYRGTSGRAELMKPGTVYEFTIEPFPTGNVFKKGHRIRLDISSSNFPRFDVNPNTGEPLGRDRRLVVADNTIFHDAGRPSRVVLSIVPRRAGGRTAGQ